ncbi:MAG: nucleotide pyrophosphohydrolase [Desulfobacteraceae bacterium]|nr:nucleotide pyrophosphohydrolase [Desulfobacteraceae bacterium]
MGIKQIQKQLQKFADERDWNQFHNPKNLAIALSIEASELLEKFQWLNMEQSENIVADPVKKHEIGEEIADVAMYLFRLADRLDIDIEEVVDNKIEKNAIKYPAEKVRGSSKKYDEYV